MLSCFSRQPCVLLESALTEGLEKFTASETLKIMAEVRDYTDKHSMDMLIKFITVRCIFTSVQIATLLEILLILMCSIQQCDCVDR